MPLRGVRTIQLTPEGDLLQLTPKEIMLWVITAKQFTLKGFISVYSEGNYILVVSSTASSKLK